MAPKRPLPAEDPPLASSDVEFEDEEENSSSEEGEEQESGESESDDEDDNKQKQKKPSQPKPSSPPPPTKPQQKSEGGSSSSVSESESETESEPIASEPMENVETPAAKRKLELEDSEKGGKKQNVAKNGSLQELREESKKPIFQKIWSSNDEVALLQGMIAFREKKGLDPSANHIALHHFVRKSLGHEFTVTQLASKIRLLKKKYMNNKGKGKGKGGQGKTFSNPYEQNVFDLSKKIWGVSGQQSPMPKAKGTSKKGKNGGTKLKMESEGSKLEPSQSLPRRFEHSDLLSMFSCDKMVQLSRVGCDEDFLKKGLEMVDESKMYELKERWGKLQVALMRVLAERAELIRYQTNLILEACHQATGK